MKKILWLIFLVLIINKVDAKVYYSDYSDYSPFQEEEVLSSDTIDVIKEERYLWYKDKEILGDYKLYNEVDKFSNDCYLTDYTDWSNQKIDNVGYVYDSRTKYNYTMAKGIRYIHLFDLQGSYGSFRITELDIKYKNKSINYTYTCEGCFGDFDDYIHNGIYEENKSYISNGGSLIIDLGKEYPIHLVETVFYIFDLGDTDKLYTIGYSTDKKNLIYSKQYKLKFSDENWVNSVKRVHNSDEINTSIWQYKESSTGLRNNDFVVKKENVTEYRYQEKWCKVYETVQEYSDYSKEPVDDYINKIDDSLKYFYSYRKRDKLELDIKEITDKNFDLNNFVISSSDEVKINNNIDWNKNGTYKVSFQVNDLKVDENVVLNVESNTIEELKKQLENLKNEYDNKIKELEEQLSNCNNECFDIENQSKQYEKQLSSLNEDILKYQKEINSLKNLNDQYLNKIKELEDDIKRLNNGIENITKEKDSLINQLNSYKDQNDIEVPKFMLKIGSLDNKIILIILLLLLCLSFLIGKHSNKK